VSLLGFRFQLLKISQHIRLYATNHLGELIRASPIVNSWTLRLLLTQLYDPSPDVCETAVHYLEEACEDKEILHLVVEMQPVMDHLGEIGDPLLLKSAHHFLSSTIS
jgi:rapamycin-insensitive companion of mTOR